MSDFLREHEMMEELETYMRRTPVRDLQSIRQESYFLLLTIRNPLSTITEKAEAKRKLAWNRKVAATLIEAQRR